MSMEYTIDGVDLENERLIVHQQDLTTLIQQYTYIESVFYLLTGYFPSDKEKTQFNQGLVKLFQSVIPLIEKNNCFDDIARLSIPYEQKIIASMALMDQSDLKEYALYVSALFPMIENQLDLSIGLAIFVLVPMFTGFFQEKNYFDEIQIKINEVASYLDIVFMAFTGKTTTLIHEKISLDKLLIAFYAGFGITTPSIILPRFSASTKASMLLNLIAGFTGSGTAHVGACREMMLLFKSFNALSDKDVIRQIQNLIDAGKKIPGFGHPLFYQDPRTEVLYQLAITQLPNNAYLELYRIISEFMWDRYQLYPNVDAIAAAILSALGVDPELGSILFLWARIPAMIAHSIEKKSRPAFGFKRSEARERFERFPVDWI